MKKKLAVGMTANIDAAFDGGAADSSVSYSVPADQQAVITVDASGVVTAVAEGTGVVEIKDPVSGDVIRAVVFEVLLQADYDLQAAVDAGTTAFTISVAEVAQGGGGGGPVSLTSSLTGWSSYGGATLWGGDIAGSMAIQGGKFDSAVAQFGSGGSWHGPAIDYDLGNDVTGDYTWEFDFDFNDTIDPTAYFNVYVLLLDAAGNMVTGFNMNDSYAQFNQTYWVAGGAAAVGSTVSQGGSNELNNHWKFQRVSGVTTVYRDGQQYASPVSNNPSVGIRTIRVVMWALASAATVPTTVGNMTFTNP